MITLMDQWRMALALTSDPSLNASAVRVGLALLGFQNRRTGRCYPSLETLGEASNLRRTATWRAVSALEAAGWIWSKGSGGRELANEYGFNYERLKPFADADGIEPKTVHVGELLEPETVRGSDLNGSLSRMKPFAFADPNPKGLNPEGFNPEGSAARPPPDGGERLTAPPAFEPGDVVIHRRHGLGTVRCLVPDPAHPTAPYVTVAFAEGEHDILAAGLRRPTQRERDAA